MTATTTKTKRSAKRPAAKVARRAAKRVPARNPLPPKGTLAYVQALLERYRDVDFHKLPLKERKKMVEAFRGSFAWVDYSVDEFIAERRAEAERENRE